MSGFRKKWSASGALLLSLSAAPWALAQHEGDVLVGHTAGGQLAIGGFPVEREIVLLPTVNGPLLFGWSDNEPGFDHVVTPDPPGDLFPLQSGAQIRLQVLAIDPAFRIIDEGFQVLDAPGESTLLGDSQLHAHLIWHINSQSVAFDRDQVIWQATLQLLDVGSTGYEPSEPFTMTFTNTPGVVPALGTWGLIAMTLLLLAGGVLVVTRNRRPAAGQPRRMERQS
jgi:hypothetical protein